MILDSNITEIYDEAGAQWLQHKIDLEIRFCKRYNAWKYIVDTLLCDVGNYFTRDNLQNAFDYILHDPIYNSMDLDVISEYEYELASVSDIDHDDPVVISRHRLRKHRALQMQIQSIEITVCYINKMYKLLFPDELNALVKKIVEELKTDQVDHDEVKFLIEQYHLTPEQVLNR